MAITDPHVDNYPMKAPNSQHLENLLPFLTMRYRDVELVKYKSAKPLSTSLLRDSEIML